MDKIICLVGESGSGKSTIAELLEKQGYNYIQSYTTRPKRYERERGHIFVCENEYLRHKAFDNNLNNIIAYTFFNGEHYWATKEQYQGKGNSVYVIDVAGIKELRERVADAEIVVIYLKVDSKERFDRMSKNRKQSEAFTRIGHDMKAFKIVPCDYVVDANRDIEEVLKDVMTLIEMDK